MDCTIMSEDNKGRENIVNQTTKRQNSYRLWVSQRQRIISFHELNNREYQMVEFASQDDKMEYVLQKCSGGFRIQ